MNPERVPALLSRLGLLALGLASAYQLWFVFRSATVVNAFLMHRDDAYYYLVVARNIARTGVATFDGVHRTSGVQLLWTWCLVPLAHWLPGRAELVRAVLLLSVALNFTSGLLIHRLARRLHTETCAGLAVLLWAGLMTTLRPMMQGMEYPLYVPLVVATIAACHGLLSADTRPRRAQLVGLGVLLTLGYWARLDSAVLALLIGLVVAGWLARRAGSRRELLVELGWLSAPPAFGAVLYVVVCHSMAGTLMPISGAVKSFYASRFFDGESGLFRVTYLAFAFLKNEALIFKTATSGGALMRTALGHPLQLLHAAALVAGSVWFVRRTGLRLDDSRSRPLVLLLGLLALAQLHLGVLVLGLAHFSLDTQHYYAWLIVLWLLWASVVGAELLLSVSPPRRIVVAGVSLAVLAALQSRFLLTNRLLPQAELRHEDAVSAAAEYLNQSLPRDAVVGAWNAGQLAYFSDRRVINLDGLANDTAFFGLLQRGASLCGYFEREKIRYLVDINEHDKSMRHALSWDRAQSFRGAFPLRDLRLLKTIGDVSIFEIVACPAADAPV